MDRIQVKWIACAGFPKLINLFIGGECIALIKDKEHVKLVKETLLCKGYEETVESKSSYALTHKYGLTDGYKCPFCEQEEADCDCDG